MPVSDQERQQINSLVRRFEADAGIEAVAAVVGKADAYPEIPWKAYALGSALGALVACVFPVLSMQWGGDAAFSYAALAALGTGALFALAAVLMPPFGRLFLDRTRAQAEARQYALTVFVEREVFRTRNRDAVLILVTRFERVAVILPDTGLAPFVSAPDLDRIAGAMQAALAAEGITGAFAHGFEALGALVAAHGYPADGARENALDDAMIEAKGA